MIIEFFDNKSILIMRCKTEHIPRIGETISLLSDKFLWQIIDVNYSYDQIYQLDSINNSLENIRIDVKKLDLGSVSFV